MITPKELGLGLGVNEAIALIADAINNSSSEAAGPIEANQVVETAAKRFVSTEQVNTWDAKASMEVVETELTALQSSIAQTYETKTASDAKDTARGVQIEAINTAQAVQDGKVATLTVSKADLVDGVVPFSQLPNLPVGRKLVVADAAERLTLPVHPDITIAYEESTAEAWALGAGDDPSDAGNWTQLGTASVTDVVSFKGRTGNVAPQTGDYTADQITETANRLFLTPTMQTAWSAKETTSGAQTKANTAVTTAVANAKTYADNTFLAKSQRAANNGVAPLGDDGKIPAIHIPVKANRVWRDMTTSRSSGDWYTNTSGSELELYLSSNNANDGGYFSVMLRANASSPGMSFVGNSTNSSTSGAHTRVFNNITVPVGWQYSVNTTNLGLRPITRWYELS